MDLIAGGSLAGNGGRTLSASARASNLPKVRAGVTGAAPEPLWVELGMEIFSGGYLCDYSKSADSKRKKQRIPDTLFFQVRYFTNIARQLIIAK